MHVERLARASHSWRALRAEEKAKSGFTFRLKEVLMKPKKLTGFFVIAVILILCSLVFFYYSLFVSHMASYNMHRELQHIYASNQSTQSLTLSSERFKELLQWAEQDEKRWRLQLGSSVKLLFYSAIVLLILGSIQMALTIYIYTRNSAVSPMPGGAK